MKHIWSILCKSSSIDQETNLITIRDCIEQLNVTVTKDAHKAKIVIPVELELVHLWSYDNSNKNKKFEVKTELYDPENKKIHEFSASFICPKNKKRMRMLMKIKGLPVTSTGTYTFKIRSKEEKQKGYKNVAEIPLDITLEYK